MSGVFELLLHKFIIATAVIEIVGGELFDIYAIRLFVKCVPIVGLILLTAAVWSPLSKKSLICALVFGGIGDFFLIFENNFSYFIIGMLSFLISHLFYISLLLRKWQQP